MEENKNIYSVYSVVQNSLYNSISEQIICPECKKIKLDPQITTCSEDCQYSVCGECSKKIENCPKCKEKQNWKKCVVIKQLLSKLYFKCDICKSIVNFNDLKEHYNVHTSNNNQNLITDSIPIIVSQRSHHQLQTKHLNDSQESKNCIKCNCDDCVNCFKSHLFSKIINFYNFY